MNKVGGAICQQHHLSSISVDFSNFCCCCCCCCLLVLKNDECVYAIRCMRAYKNRYKIIHQFYSIHWKKWNEYSCMNKKIKKKRREYREEKKATTKIFHCLTLANWKSTQFASNQAKSIFFLVYFIFLCTNLFYDVRRVYRFFSFIHLFCFLFLFLS